MALTAVHSRSRTRRRGRGPLWVMLAGIGAAVIGLIVMAVASSREDHAESLTDLSHAYGSNFGQTQVDAAVALGHFGLGLLIFGLALTLVGLAAQLVRRG